MNNNNPFDFFQSFVNQESFSKSMKWAPNMDFSPFSNIFKEGAEVMTSTSQLISETMQSISKRGTDSFQKNTSELFNTMKDAISAGDMKQMTDCQQNYLKSTVENNISNTKEILDITSKSSMEFLDVVSKNFKNNVEKSFNKDKI